MRLHCFYIFPEITAPWNDSQRSILFQRVFQREKGHTLSVSVFRVFPSNYRWKRCSPLIRGIQSIRHLGQRKETPFSRSVCHRQNGIACSTSCSHFSKGGSKATLCTYTTVPQTCNVSHGVYNSVISTEPTVQMSPMPMKHCHGGPWWVTRPACASLQQWVLQADVLQALVQRLKFL